MFTTTGRVLKKFIRTPAGVGLALFGPHTVVNFFIGASATKLVLALAKKIPPKK